MSLKCVRGWRRRSRKANRKILSHFFNWQWSDTLTHTHIFSLYIKFMLISSVIKERSQRVCERVILLFCDSLCATISSLPAFYLQWFAISFIVSIACPLRSAMLFSLRAQNIYCVEGHEIFFLRLLLIHFQRVFFMTRPSTSSRALREYCDCRDMLSSGSSRTLFCSPLLFFFSLPTTILYDYYFVNGLRRVWEHWMNIVVTYKNYIFFRI